MIGAARSLTFEVFDDELFGGAGFRARQVRRDFIDAVRIADCQRREIGPLLRVSRGGGRRVRHDDDIVPPAGVVGHGLVSVQLRDIRSRDQFAALSSASVVQHRREIGGGCGGGSSGGGSSGNGGGGGSGSGRPLHLCCGQDLGTREPRHMRAPPGHRPFFTCTQRMQFFLLHTK